MACHHSKPSLAARSAFPLLLALGCSSSGGGPGALESPQDFGPGGSLADARPPVGGAPGNSDGGSTGGDPARDGRAPNPDDGVPPADARTPDPDDGVPPADARPPDPDDGVPPVDARPPDPDDGVAPVDARPPDPDDDVLRVDAGEAPEDARPPEPDAAPPPPPNPLITEFMARNSRTIEDEDGAHSDYIELYNPGATPFSLEGWHLTDDPENPERWTFPAVELGPHRYVVVFASNEDRVDPAGELHTNFKLDGDGEYLALVDPAGTIVQAFDEVPQHDDVAYGLPAEAVITPLVGLDSPAHALVLGIGSAPPPGVDELDFDEFNFTESQAAVGFDRNVLPEAPFILNDSTAAFAGVQGAGGWTYGYRDLAAGPEYRFTQFTDDAWNGNTWHLPGGEPPYTEVNRLGGHPNGRNQGGVHWSIRRWTASGPGRVRIRGLMGTYGRDGDGTDCRVLVDGVEVESKHVHNERKRYEVTVDVVPGTTVDFAIDPGQDGDVASDRSLFTARIELWDAGVSDLGRKLADSVTEWSPIGAQGALGWTSGFWNRGADADEFYQLEDFTPFPRDEGRYGANDYWTGTSFDTPNGDPPWTFMDADFMHPNGDDAGAEQWAMRRWACPINGDLLIRWRVAKSQTNGRGVTGHVFHNGAELDFTDIEGADLSGDERFVVAYGVQAGDLLDFALDPRGPNGSRDGGGDLSQLSAEVWQLADLHAFIETDFSRSADLLGGVVVRVPFEVPDASAFERLRLTLRYDDGFTASINGVRAATDNAPAAVDRAAGGAVEPEHFELTDRVADLRPGTNVLTLVGHQGPALDSRFLLAPRLEGLRIQMDAEVFGYLPAPSPGADNLPPDFAAPPQVQTLSKWPQVRAGDPISLLARVDPGTSAIERVTATVRVMFGLEETHELFDNGDGTWGAVMFLEAFPGQLVRWRISAFGADGQEKRDPAFEDSLESEAWYGTVIDDPTIDTRLPVMHWFVGRPDEAASERGTRGLIFWRGELYDNVDFGVHGQSSRGFPKHSFNLDFPGDHRFTMQGEPGEVRAKDVNLLSNWADKSKLRNTLAWETYRDAHADHHVAFPVRVQQNGGFYGLYDLVEDADDRWLERMGRNPEGALYKMYDSFENVANAEKKNRREESKADLEAFLNALNLSGDELRNYLYDEVNIPAMVNFLAAMIVTSSLDCCHKNYYAYRDTGVTDRWWFMIWDLDLSFGRNWTGGYFDDRMYPENPLYVGGNNRLTRPLFALPEFQEMYHRRLRTLFDTLLQQPGTAPEDLRYEARISELVDEIGADGQADINAWPQWGEAQTFDEAVQHLRVDYLAARREYVYRALAGEFGGLLPPPVEPLVIIDEVDASPANPSQAYVRLTNLSPGAVDVSDWRLTGAGVELRLEPGAVLPFNGRLYAVADVRAFKARASGPAGGQGLLVLGNWSGILSPDGELPALVDAADGPVFP